MFIRHRFKCHFCKKRFEGSAKYIIYYSKLFKEWRMVAWNPPFFDELKILNNTYKICYDFKCITLGRFMCGTA